MNRLRTLSLNAAFCRLLEEELIGRMQAADVALTRERASAALRRWLLAALEDDTDTEMPADGKQGAGGGGAVGSEVNGAVLDARSPRDLLLADDRCAAAGYLVEPHCMPSVWSGYGMDLLGCADAWLLSPYGIQQIAHSSQRWQVSYRWLSKHDSKCKHKSLVCRRVLQWAASSAGGEFVSAELRALAAEAKARQMQQLAAATDGGECNVALCDNLQDQC